MSKEIDEDLIEATIRKVAEARAARESQPEADRAASDDDLSKWDAKAAEIDDDAVAATLARIQAQPPRDPELAASDDDLSKWDAKAAEIDDDAVAATLARIQAREPQPEAGQAASDDDLSKWDDKAAEIDDDAVAATLARIQAQPPATVAPANANIDHLRDATVVAELHGLLERTVARVTALEAQVAALSATLRTVTSAVAVTTVPSQSAPADDDWDDVPPPTSSGFGAPPRPATLRDPSPWSAAAAKLEPAETPAASAQAEEPRAADVPRPRLHAIGGSDAADEQPQRSGFDLLPKAYRITIEDKRRNVDLVPLHRALLGIDGVRDMSLLSYANGAAIVSVETLGDLAPESLQRAVSHAMARDAEVQVHNETTMVVKIAEE